MGVSPHFLNHGHLCFFVCWNVIICGGIEGVSHKQFNGMFLLYFTDFMFT